jgi:hypothetical protein
MGKVIPIKKSNAEHFMIPDFKLWYRAIVTKNKHIEKWNRVKDPEINLHSYRHLIFDKEARNINWRKWCWDIYM